MKIKKNNYQAHKKNKWPLYILGAVILYFAACTYLFLTLTSIKQDFRKYEGNTPTKIIHKTVGNELFNFNDYRIPHYEEVRIPATEDIMLNAWYITGKETQPVVVLVSGKDSSKADPKMILIAGMLWKHGFDVLLLDPRNQGTSTKTHGRTSLGTEEYDDVLASIQWLSQKNYSESQIGLMGCSLGGVINAIAFSENENIKALFLDSPFSDPKEMIKEEFKKRHVPRFFVTGSLLIGKTFFGQDLTERTPFKALKSLSNRSLFIAHSQKDKTINIKHSEHLLNYASLHPNAYVDHWFHNYEGHCTAMIQAPREYEDHLVNFFIQSLKKNVAPL